MHKINKAVLQLSIPIIISSFMALLGIIGNQFTFFQKIEPNLLVYLPTALLAILFIVLIRVASEKHEMLIDILGSAILIVAILCFLLSLFSFFCLFSNLFGNDEKEEIIKKIILLFYIAACFSCPSFIWIKKHKSLYIPAYAEIATTGTCIPFKEKGVHIDTYIIFNDSAYEENMWMFPGGHAFSEGDNSPPESIAISKAKQEAGLNVKILNLFNNHPDSERKKGNYKLLKSPHYTYSFSQSKNVKCYKQRGHRFHYDAVFVCEIENEEETMNDTIEKLPIRLSNKPLTYDDVNSILTTTINEYAGKKPAEKQAAYRGFGNYVVEMLYKAYNDYLKYLDISKKNSDFAKTEMSKKNEPITFPKAEIS